MAGEHCAADATVIQLSAEPPPTRKNRPRRAPSTAAAALLGSAHYSPPAGAAAAAQPPGTLGPACRHNLVIKVRITTDELLAKGESLSS